MKVLFILLFTFLGLGVPTIEQNTFNEVVHDNYDYYQVLIKEETSNNGLSKTLWISSETDFNNILFVAIIKDKK